jgi:N-acetylglutamate synthase-like GNAT family acetyltransferase
VGIELRVMREEDRAAATACDDAAMQTFRDAGLDLPDDPEEIGGDLVLVGLLDGRVVGVAAVELQDDAWHLAEMAVHPGAQRRGVGTSLLLDVLDRAHRAGVAAVTLTTFRDVPFNGPFYLRHGFEVVDETTYPWLRSARAHERATGIDLAPRVAMRRLL